MSVPALLPGGCSSALQLCRSQRLPKLVPSFGRVTLNDRLVLIASHTFYHKQIPVCVFNAGGQRSEERQEHVLIPEIVEPYKDSGRKQTVAVFWDLDNKPPNTVRPYDAAQRLKRLAGEFGEVVDMVAYANQNAFTYVPVRVREERQERRTLDRLERIGVAKVDQPYICTMCGRKCKNNLTLKKHFKQLHERERNKRMAYVGQLKGMKRTKFLEKVSAREAKYKEAARTVLVPKVGYGLASDLRRAGVLVRTVEKRPQAADEALVRHMTLYINEGIECIFLVSDDSDFRDILRNAKVKRVCTVVVGDTGTLRGVADVSFSWEDVESGRGMLSANDKFQRWANEDALRTELLDDTGLNDEAEDVNFSNSDDEEEFREFQRTLGRTSKLSPFADDEEEYYSSEDEEYLDEEETNEKGRQRSSFPHIRSSDNMF